MVTEELYARMTARLGARGVVGADAEKQPYEAGARHGTGSSVAVVRPADAEELAWVVAEFAEGEVPFMAQGAATGLVAAGTPSRAGTQWVVSTQRLRDVLVIDPVNRSATVSAGYRLSDVNRAAADHGLIFPIDLGADPTVGGMVATNTGGARLLRYGGVRENLLDVEAVLAVNGRRVGRSRGLHKDNTGLTWSQLLCGTFGAFGIVTRATLKLHPVQLQSATALVAVDSTETAMSLLCSLEDEAGEFVSAFEGISGPALDAVATHGNLLLPFAQLPAYAVLVELSSAVPTGRGVDVEALLMEWLERRMELGGVVDAVVDKPAQLWRIRHSVSESVQALGRMVAFDLSVARSLFAAFRHASIGLIQAVLPGTRVCDFGHLGDGGVHLNLVVPEGTEDAHIQVLRDTIYDLAVREFGGSYSAEHGIGPYNRRWYERYAEPEVREWAGVLHRHFDPRGRMGNVRLD